MRNRVPHRVFVSGSFTTCKRRTISEMQAPWIFDIVEGPEGIGAET